MGYLDNSSVTIDAILTLKGRELLARGRDEFQITQFALGDDEIDYTLWNPDHPLGTDYYGAIIENLPVVEAIPDETQALRSKLVTLPKQTTNIPVVSVSNTSITLKGPGETAKITPNTINLSNGNSLLGYSAIVSDSRILDISVTNALTTSVLPTTPRFVGDNEDSQTVTVHGFEFHIMAKAQYIEDKTATITIIGNETGGSATVTVTVKKITAETKI